MADPAPFFSNLFLFYYKMKWGKKVEKIDIRQIRRFC